MKTFLVFLVGFILLPGCFRAPGYVFRPIQEDGFVVDSVIESGFRVIEADLVLYGEFAEMIPGVDIPIPWYGEMQAVLDHPYFNGGAVATAQTNQQQQHQSQNVLIVTATPRPLPTPVPTSTPVPRGPVDFDELWSANGFEEKYPLSPYTTVMYTQNWTGPHVNMHKIEAIKLAYAGIPFIRELHFCFGCRNFNEFPGVSGQPEDEVYVMAAMYSNNKGYILATDYDEHFRDDAPFFHGSIYHEVWHIKEYIEDSKSAHADPYNQSILHMASRSGAIDWDEGEDVESLYREYLGFWENYKNWLFDHAPRTSKPISLEQFVKQYRMMVEIGDLFEPPSYEQ